MLFSGHMQQKIVTGVDVGGTGIKGAPVDLASGKLTTDWVKMPTPDGAKPKDVAAVVAEVVAASAVDDTSAVGVTIPGVVQHGMVHSAANIDDSWIGTDANALFSEVLARQVRVVNDADAAGYAETRYGAAKGHPGTVIVTTLGTGIGTAVIIDGRLVPNTELGHLEIDGKDAEEKASNLAREEKDLSWEEWAERLTVYYRTLEKLFSPDLFVVGGGVSKKADRFLPLLDIETEIVPATLGNTAGIVGAALLAYEDTSA
jgi:polyphosphate glucokinase